MSREDPPLITRSRIVRDLRSLGLEAGQVVMLHASVKAVGWVVGGPDVVLDALLEVLTPAGTLMMYIAWEDGTYEMRGWPEEKRQAYLDECPGFDASTSRAHRKWSVLTEYLRTRPGARRSGNPEWSMAAVGEKAGWLTKDHPMNHGAGPGSPMARLVEAGGKVLLLGAPLTAVSLLHYAEYVARVPNKRSVRYSEPVMQEGRREWVEIEELDSEDGIADWPGPGGDYFTAIMQEFLSSGRGRQGLVGAGESYLLDAAELVDFAARWMEREFGGGQ
jgi:aminoglycoside 3-N-acetyltransferase